MHDKKDRPERPSMVPYNHMQAVRQSLTITGDKHLRVLCSATPECNVHPGAIHSELRELSVRTTGFVVPMVNPDSWKDFESGYRYASITNKNGMSNQDDIAKLYALQIATIAIKRRVTPTQLWIPTTTYPTNVEPYGVYTPSRHAPRENLSHPECRSSHLPYFAGVTIHV